MGAANCLVHRTTQPVRLLARRWRRDSSGTLKRFSRVWPRATCATLAAYEAAPAPVALANDKGSCKLPLPGIRRDAGAERRRQEPSSASFEVDSPCRWRSGAVSRCR